MIEKITLILGGVQSGKSHLGEELALAYGRKPVYLSTAEGIDDEMKARIRTHQRRRSERFDLHEEPLDLRPVMNKCAKQTVLVDCLTQHLYNRMLKAPPQQSVDQLWENDRGYLNELLSIHKEKEINLILISNEVGSAPVPDKTLGRSLQYLQGLWNRHLAQMAHQVIQVTAGIPKYLKQEPAARFCTGAPASVLPADILQNCLYLRQHVQDIQLRFFDNPSKALLPALRHLKEGEKISYSVHMPPTPAIYEQPAAVLENASRLIETLAPLSPITHTFHFDVPTDYISEQDNSALVQIYIDFFSELNRRFPGLPFSLENHITKLEVLDPVIDACAITYAINLGHLLKQGHGLSEVRERLRQAAVIFLHHAAPIAKGSQEMKDHLPLPQFAPYFSLLTDYSGLVTIENFHPSHLEQSLEAMRNYF